MPKSHRNLKEVEVDAHVGAKLRQARILKNLTPTKLANLLSLTFQQVQKNEKGANRIGASRLWKLSQILEVPVSYFFEGLESETRMNVHDVDAAKTNRRKSLELVRNFYAIQNERAREAAYQLIKDMAKPDD